MWRLNLATTTVDVPEPVEDLIPAHRVFVERAIAARRRFLRTWTEGTGSRSRCCLRSRRCSLVPVKSVKRSGGNESRSPKRARKWHKTQSTAAVFRDLSDGQTNVPVFLALRRRATLSGAGALAPGRLHQGYWFSLLVLVLVLVLCGSGGDSRLCLRHCRKLERLLWLCHEFGGVRIFGCQFSRSLCVGNWLLQFSANSELECVYSWSAWGEGGYTCLDMSGNTCGVAVDATVPEVALDVSDSASAASQWIYALASGYGVYGEFLVFLRADVLADITSRLDIRQSLVW